MCTTPASTSPLVTTSPEICHPNCCCRVPRLPILRVLENSLQDILQILDDAEGDCHWDEGDRVWYKSYPQYDSRNCEFLEQAFRCSENGRPNNTYAKWQWQPKNCNLPRFDAVIMLEKLQNRRLVFVGDSMGRNQWQALLCMLSSAIAEKDSIYEVNGNTITKHTGFLIIKFKSDNCTVEYYRSPFLVLQGQLPLLQNSHAQSSEGRHRPSKKRFFGRKGRFGVRFANVTFLVYW